MNLTGQPAHVGRHCGSNEYAVEKEVVSFYADALDDHHSLHAQYAPPLLYHSECYKFVGEWAGPERFREELAKGDVGPYVLVGKEAERLELAMLLCPREGSPPDDRFLLLTCEAISPFNESEESCLTLIGGFDSSSKVRDLSQETSFLALQFPASDSETLRRQVGTVDF